MLGDALVDKQQLVGSIGCGWDTQFVHPYPKAWPLSRCILVSVQALYDLSHKRNTFASCLTNNLLTAVGQMKHVKHLDKWFRGVAPHSVRYQLVHILSEVQWGCFGTDANMIDVTFYMYTERVNVCTQA